MMGVFYKVVFDISCYYLFVTFFFSYVADYKTNPMSFGVFLLAALVLGFSEQLKRLNSRRAMALASITVPALTLLTETELIGRIEVLLLWVYFAAMVLKESYVAYHYHFLEKFRILLWTLLVPGIFMVFDSKAGVPALTLAVPYVIIFLAAGVMTLQTARYRAAKESRKQFERFQIGQTLCFFLLCFLLTSAGLLEKLYLGILRPAAMLIAQAGVRVFAAIIMLFPVEPPDLYIDREGFEYELSKAEPSDIRVERNEWAEMIMEMAEQNEVADPTILYVTVTVLFAVVLLIVLMSKHSASVRIKALDVEREDMEEPDEQVQKPCRHSVHPELVVRFYYREFMKKAESKAQSVELSDTTEEIEEKYKKKVSANPENAEEIKQLYRSIRYGKKKAEKEDAARMKVLVKGA